MAVVFDNIPNFRDVGKTVNDFLGRKVLREGVLYRSARPDDATPEDRRRLASELGIRTVVDLRTKTEHLKQAEKRKQRQREAAAAADPEEEEEEVRIPGIHYREIKVTGPRFERFLLSQLSWWNFFKLIIIFLLGYRTRAIRIITREAMLPRGLIGLGTITLDKSGPEISEILHALVLPSSTPLLIHCTQGKDRTGLIVALILMALSSPSPSSSSPPSFTPIVPLPAIEHDYLLTRASLSEAVVAAAEEMREIGLTPEWAECPGDFVRAVRAHLDAAYGGVVPYLEGIGVGAEARRRLVEVLGA
ncbi:protein-tyrosine phosphatase-like protein [Biscogniauxia mediterranea]|nr:protein-tyrosine phosphatase-like protein [Biscogniauxia mediterranea]